MNKKQPIFTNNAGEGYTREDKWNKNGTSDSYGQNQNTPSDEPTRTM